MCECLHVVLCCVAFTYCRVVLHVALCCVVLRLHIVVLYCVARRPLDSTGGTREHHPCPLQVGMAHTRT